ncbi:MAG: hypothetical protein WA820_22255, partial [Bradyrhizobium sp.]
MPLQAAHLISGTFSFSHSRFMKSPSRSRTPTPFPGGAVFSANAVVSSPDWSPVTKSMIRKSGNRFSLATNANGVCAEIMPKQ